MNNDNVNSNAKIINHDEDSKFTLGNFVSNNMADEIQSQSTQLDDKSINGNVDPVLVALSDISNKIQIIENKVNSIENDGVKGRDLDQQLVQALKDLKNYASFFEQATFQLESKILKTSMNIAKKIIAVELGEQSSEIAKMTIENILNKIKTASQITIHLNPKDYVILKDELNLDSYILIQEDSNVTAGGVVIASDLGNFDGNVEAKVQTVIESLETVL
jgi:flagellar assembly protein FliH